MMKNIISPARRVERVSFSLCFDLKTNPSAGFMFPCDESGALIESELSDCSRQSLAFVEARIGTEYYPPYVSRFSHSYWEPAVIRCRCGNALALRNGDTQCQCGALYNAVGQELLPRSEWETDDAAEFEAFLDERAEAAMFGPRE